MNIPEEDIESIQVFKYDFDHQTYDENFYFKPKHVSELVEAINNFEGKQSKDLLYTGEEENVIGFRIHGKKEYSFILLDHLLLKSDGKFYSLEEEQVRELIKEFASSTQGSNQLKYVVNHRELSLINGKWYTEYMLKSTVDLLDNDLIAIHGNIQGSEDDRTLKYVLKNKTSYKFIYGKYLELETKIGDTWYQINDMTPSGLSIAWDDEGVELLANETTVHQDKFLNNFYPLPKGTYRIIKELYNEDKKYYVAFEFKL